MHKDAVCQVDHPICYRAVKGSTVESPIVVREFLDVLNDNLQPKAALDFREMQMMKDIESPAQQVGILCISYLNLYTR